ncbi:MAG: single-stranded DNA-binding protein [Ruminococcus sp.]|nr:single-stranded DNA-binding protein [Ruminococcus sp.]
MNHIELLGRLTKDPEVKYTSSGKAACQFTLAVNRSFSKAGEAKGADFIPIVAWGRMAEAIGNNVYKGQRLLVEGRLQVRTYIAKDGQKKWISEVVAHNCEFIEYRTKEQNTDVDDSIQSQNVFESMGSIEPDYSDIDF